MEIQSSFEWLLKANECIESCICICSRIYIYICISVFVSVFSSVFVSVFVSLLLSISILIQIVWSGCGKQVNTLRVGMKQEGKLVKVGSHREGGGRT